ncbi:MAG: GFA family protein [Alcanivoracaceae bacterium]
METASHCQCECGAASFSVRGAPLMRGFCHCTICQTFNEAPFADITLFRRRDVEMPAADSVAYRNYASPAMLYRGKCVKCHKPAVEYMDFPLMPDVVIVPTGTISNQAIVPSPTLHIFYDKRQQDVDDGLPKHRGYLASQCAFGWHLLKALTKK